MTIETEHRGHLIRYGENSEDWYCPDINLSHKSLAQVKLRIDKMYLDMRKQARLDCFEIPDFGPYSDAPEKIPAKIVEYIGPKIERYKDNPKVVGNLLAVVSTRSNKSKTTRRQEELSKLMPDTPEAHVAFDEYVRLRIIENEARKSAQAAFKLIPRVNIDMIAELVRIKESGQYASDE